MTPPKRATPPAPAPGAGPLQAAAQATPAPTQPPAPATPQTPRARYEAFEEAGRWKPDPVRPPVELPKAKEQPPGDEEEETQKEGSAGPKPEQERQEARRQALNFAGSQETQEWLTALCQIQYFILNLFPLLSMAFDTAQVAQLWREKLREIGNVPLLFSKLTTARLPSEATWQTVMQSRIEVSQGAWCISTHEGDPSTSSKREPRKPTVLLALIYALIARAMDDTAWPEDTFPTVASLLKLVYDKEARKRDLLTRIRILQQPKTSLRIVAIGDTINPVDRRSSKRKSQEEAGQRPYTAKGTKGAAQNKRPMEQEDTWQRQERGKAYYTSQEDTPWRSWQRQKDDSASSSSWGGWQWSQWSDS